MKDVSQTGFRLAAPMSAASGVTLNTLAAIRPYGHAFWTLGIVRRMRRLTADRAEIGLQVIANTLVGVELVEQKKGGGAAPTTRSRASGARSRAGRSTALPRAPQAKASPRSSR